MRRDPPLTAFVNGRAKHVLATLHHDQLVRAAFGCARPGVIYEVRWRRGAEVGVVGLEDAIEVAEGMEFQVDEHMSPGPLEGSHVS